jgi:hypothetical protein
LDSIEFLSKSRHARLENKTFLAASLFKRIESFILGVLKAWGPLLVAIKDKPDVTQRLLQPISWVLYCFQGRQT